MSNRHRPRLGPKPQVQGQQKAKVVQHPSEEDLLFLLMSRARQNNGTRRRLEHLEQENKDLRQDQLRAESELKQVLDARAGTAQEYDLLSQNLDRFKEKYHKLKKWALETNRDCEELQEKASNFRKGLSVLTKEKDQLQTQLHDAQTSSTAAFDGMEHLRKGVKEVKALAENRLAQIEKLQPLVEEQDKRLKTEMQRCQNLESQINQLIKDRETHNIRTHDIQQGFSRTLQDICGKLEVLQAEKLEEDAGKGRVLECLGEIQSTLEKDSSKKSDLVSLQQGLVSIGSSLEQAKRSVSQGFENALSALKDDLQKMVSAQMETVLPAIKNDRNRMTEAGETLTRLEEKAGSIQEMTKLVQKATAAAENSMPSLTKMAENLAKVVGPERDASKKKINSLNTDISEWRLKWQTACSQMEQSKQEREKENKNYQAQLETFVQERREEREACKAQHDAELIDSYGLLSEAINQERSLRSEASKADDFVRALQRQAEQDKTELVRSGGYVVGSS